MTTTAIEHTLGCAEAVLSRRSTRLASQGTSDHLLKFVNVDDYNIVKPKEGWLKVKDKRGKTDRWVRVDENTLSYYTSPEDVSDPIDFIENVDKCTSHLKL